MLSSHQPRRRRLHPPPLLLNSSIPRPNFCISVQNSSQSLKKMDLALRFSTSIYPVYRKRAIPEMKSFTATTKKLPSRVKISCSVAVAPEKVSEGEIEKRKYELLTAIQETQRGFAASADQRSVIEEALVSVEGCNLAEPIDLVKLDGTWRLQYTSAPDVLILLEAAQRLPFFQVGRIFQKFECRDQTKGGVIRIVVRWSIPSLLEEQEGATLVVSAKFDVVSVRNIYLQFEEIKVQDINISDQVQALIAPALLPRSFLSLQILQFIRTFKAEFLVTSPERRSVGGLYYLSYLDRDMLLGRAVGGGGLFVFTKAQPLQL